MSTKWCHQCGSEFVARVEVCPDCAIELSPDPPGPRAARMLDEAGVDLTVDDAPRPGDHVVYELHEWSEEARHLLDQLLRSGLPAGSEPGAGAQRTARNPFEDHLGPLLTGRSQSAIRHVWQGTDLVVPYEEQERAEAFIDQVEVTVMLALDPEADQVAYDLSDLTDEQLQLVGESLSAEGIPHGFDEEGDELVVHGTDEERVEAILDAVDFPDALAVDDDQSDDDGLDPLAAQDAMSDLFVAADRLRKDARDPDGAMSLVETAGVAARLPLPYGFSEADWQAVVERSGSVAALIEADDTDDEMIEQAADRLRSLLRQYV